MKKYLSTIILVAALLTGLSLLLYPNVSNYWNSIHQTRAIASYQEQLDATDNHVFEQMLADAQAYNESLRKSPNRYNRSEDELARYNSLLNISGTGIMGYIEIPILQVRLPMYHGVKESVLQIAAGHIEGSSLPVGGPGTHCVLSGHRGLPTARLFTDLDQLTVGDIFILHVLDQTLTYEVDNIAIVKPDDLSLLEIEDGKDLCTLVTCTPYGVNTHRLLVRGHRTDNLPEEKILRIEADAKQIDPMKVVPFVAAPMLVGLFLIMLIQDRRRSKERRKNPKEQENLGQTSRQKENTGHENE
jgi:sortase A